MKAVKAKLLGSRKASGGLLGSELTELAKQCTAKDLEQPDPALMQQLADVVNSSSEVTGARQMQEVLHQRFNMKNPHKVWLAVHLAETLLEKCGEVLAPVRSDIYQDLATVASKPLDRFHENFKDEQRAKMHAFAILRNGNKQSQSILRHACKLGRSVNLNPSQQMGDGKVRLRTREQADAAAKPDSRSNSATGLKAESGEHGAGGSTATDGGGSSRGDGERSGRSSSRRAHENGSSSRGEGAGGNGRGEGSKRDSKMSWPQVQKAVTTSLGIAGSHTTMVQDMVLTITSGKSSAPEFEKQFLGELVEEMVTFRSAFEQLLGSLSSFKHPDAKPLVEQALQAVDDMNAALALYKDVVGATQAAAVEAAGKSKHAQDGGASRPSSTDGGGSSRDGVAKGSGIPPARSGRSSSLGRSSGGGRHRSSQTATAERTGSGGLGHYAPAAQRGSSSRAAPSPLETTNGLAQALPRSGSGGRASGEGSRKSSKPTQRTGPGSDSPADLFTTAAASGPQQAPALGFSQGQLPISQQYMPQAPMYYQQPGQGSSQSLPQGFIPMPHPPVGGQPTFYMPVTGPNGEQGFAPVTFPPGQIPPDLSQQFAAMPGGVPGSLPMQFQPSAALSAAATPGASQPLQPFPSLMAPRQLPMQPGQHAQVPQGLSAAQHAAPYAPAAAYASNPAMPQQGSASAAAAAPLHPNSNNPFAPSLAVNPPAGPAAAAATNGSAYAAEGDKPGHGADIGGITDSDTDSVPRAISSDSFAAPFRRLSSSGSMSAAGNNIPRVESTGSEIYPSSAASGVLAQAGLRAFVPSAAPAAPSAAAAAADGAPDAGAPRVPAKSSASFDEVFDALTS